MLDKHKDKLRTALFWAIPICIIAGIVAFCANLERAENTGKVRIRYMIWGDSSETTVMFKDVVDEFERLHPNIDVELLILPWNEYHRKIFTMVAAHSRLDVMRLSTSYYNQLMERGAILCLDEFIQRDREEVDLDDFYEGTLQNCFLDGRCYGLTIQAYPMGFFYNVDLFHEAGVSPPDRTWTWRGKFLQVAKRLTKRRADGMIEQYGCMIDTSRDPIMLFVTDNGGDMFNADNSKCTFDSPQTREAIQFVYDLLKVHKVAPLPEQLTDQRLFAAGKVAMMPGLRSNVPIFRKQLSFEWDVGPAPGWKGKPKRIPGGGGNPRAIYSRTEHPEEAWEFLKFLTGKKAGKILAGSGRYCMARRSAAESDEFLKTTPPQHNEYFLDDARCPNKVMRPPFPRYATLSKIFEDNFHLLLQGDFGEGKPGVAKFCQIVQEQVGLLIIEEANRKKTAAAGR